MEQKLDYKKQYKELYMPKTTPSIIMVEPMTFIMVDGKGDPNIPDGEYANAVGLLYALSYMIKMSKMGNHAPDGYFEYVVPPLEGLWWMAEGVDYSRKDKFLWISMIRQPEFVTQEVFLWACEEVEKKKHLDTSGARLSVFEEGLCVQCMHIGSFDDEDATIARMEQFIMESSLEKDIGDLRRHHEIYLSDPRKGDIAKRKTVIRIPVIK